MRRSLLLALAPALLLTTTTPTAAQHSRDLWWEYDGPRRLELAVQAGMFLSTDWSDLVFLETIGATGDIRRQVLLREFAMAPELGGAASVTYWKGRYGFRVHGGFTRSCLTTGTECTSPAAPGQDDDLERTEIDMDTYVYGVQGIVGLMEHSSAQWFRPYFLVGAGGVTYDLANPLSITLPGPFTSQGGTRVTTADGAIFFDNDPLALLISTSEVGLETRIAVDLGVGIDFRVPVGLGGLSLRAEVADQISQTPLSLRVARLDGAFRGIDETEFNGRAVHNWRVTLGAALEFGLRDVPLRPRDF